MGSHTLIIFMWSILFILQQVATISASGMCYQGEECGPSTWGGSCQTGQSQSPINIPYSSKLYNQSEGRKLYMSKCYHKPQQFKLRNSAGRTATAMLWDHDPTSCYVEGNLLGRTYFFNHLNFHWGSTNNVGSEHTINRNSFAMEAQLIHYDSTKGSFVRARDSGDPQALAALSIFFRLSKADNPALTPIVRLLNSVQDPDKVTYGKGLYLSDFLHYIPHIDLGLVQYDGSLTTPDCKETVLWNVVRPTAPISAAQLEAFRTSLMDYNGTTLVDNFRPVQPLNSRKIRYYKLSNK